MKKEIIRSDNDRLVERIFGQVLRKLREERGLSQESLGFQSGYHRTYISLLERGQKNPSLRALFRLSGALNIEATEMIQQIQSLILKEDSVGKRGF